MPEFIRAFVPGGTFFLTLVTYGRQAVFHEAFARNLLHAAIAEVRQERPFEIQAMVLLPDHLHWIVAMPSGDSEYPARMSKIKSLFTRAYLAAGGKELEPSRAKQQKRMRGVWQPRYWEHTVRNEADLVRHAEYIFYNPVKHGHARCVHDWPWSTFHDAVAKEWYDLRWGCSCKGTNWPKMDFGKIAELAGE